MRMSDWDRELLMRNRGTNADTNLLYIILMNPFYLNGMPNSSFIYCKVLAGSFPFLLLLLSSLSMKALFSFPFYFFKKFKVPSSMKCLA